MRITKSTSLLPAVQRGKAVQIFVDGQPIQSFEGETVAAALLTDGRLIFRHTAKENRPRGIYCGMGICYDCLVTIDGMANIRACVTEVSDGMQIETKDTGWKPC